MSGKCFVDNGSLLSAILSRLLATCLFLLSAVSVHAAPDADYWELWDRHDASSTEVIEHSKWGQFLNQYLIIGNDGTTRVMYQAAQKQGRELLASYLSMMTQLDPRLYSRAEQFAYWVNLYNALTVALILEHYPVDSIREIGGGFFRRGPWNDKVIEVAGVALTLNDIEHRILRPIWKDKRIHYAVNCASIGCPNLAQEPFKADRLEQQLDKAAATFINQDKGVKGRGGEWQLSSIYDWYEEDFGSRADMFNHFLQYAEEDKASRLRAVDADSVDLDFAYDWSLNDIE